VFIKDNEKNYSTKRMCNLFAVGRSGYYAWKNKMPTKRQISNEDLDKKIQHIFASHQSCYGSPRLTKELKEKCVLCSENRVARRMKTIGIKAKGKRKYKITTDSNHNLPVAQNILNRDFTAVCENQKWCGDISYIYTDEGWLYLAVVIDLYSRAVVGWSMQSTMTRQLVCDALKMALWNRKFPKKVLFHSDQGRQYCSDDYQKLLRENNFICSMSRKGNCWDNAVAESFFHTLKTELV
jgi:transposase InsO family protein